MKILLDGKPENKGHVFVYDPQGRLRFKLWFYGDGRITYREWNTNHMQVGREGNELSFQGMGELELCTLVLDEVTVSTKLPKEKENNVSS